MNHVLHYRPGRGTAVDIDSLVAELSSKDGLVRRPARAALVEIGEPAVPALMQGLSAPQDHARWEAAKALCEIHAPEAAPALVERLEDPNFSVRWLAAEALVGLGEAALHPVLQALVLRPDSPWLRQGAHHILRSLAHAGYDGVLLPVLQALESVDPSLETPVAAEKALMRLDGLA